MWLLQSVQSVWWLYGNHTIDVFKLFESLTDQQPQSFYSQGQVNYAEGSVGDCKVNLQLTGGSRLDLVQQPFASEGGVLQFFSETSKALNEFRELRAKVLLPHSFRIALVATFAKEFHTNEEASRDTLAASGFARSEDAPDVEDLVFQVNRPCRVLETRKINRILRWATQRMQTVQISDGAYSVNERFLSTFNVDVNLAFPPMVALPLAEDEAARVISKLDEELVRLSEDPAQLWVG